MNEERILIACEESQAIANAFRARGFLAYSCDIKECSGGHPEYHIKGDVLDYLAPCIYNDYKGWDLMIAHPPCQYLSYAGNKNWNDHGRVWRRLDALHFFAELWTADIPRICIENPMGCATPTIAKYSQIIQPWQFGVHESKRTLLWLKNLPPLEHTKIVRPKVYAYYKTGRHKGEPMYRCGYLSSPEERAKTPWGVASAMARQWGDVLKGEKNE